MPVGAWEIEFGCTTIADPNRTSAYVANAQSGAWEVDGVNLIAPVTPAWSFLRVDCGCDALRWTADEPGDTPYLLDPYTTPALDGAPWYVASVPESAHFMGFLVERIQDIATAPTMRTVTDRASGFGGSTLGALRSKGRTMQVTLLAFGAYEAALDWGFRWLTDTLASESCSLCDVTARVACPILDESPTYAEWDTGRWTFKNVGLVEGPRYEDPPSENTACNVRRVSFTITSSTPYGYKCRSARIVDEPWLTELGSACPPASWICGNDGTVATNKTCVSVTSDYPIGEDALVVEVKAGSTDISNLLITVTPDPMGYVCGVNTPPAGWVDPAPCDQVLIPWIPAGFTLTYDGSTQVIRVTGPGGEVYDGTSFVSTETGTPPSFPTIKNGRFCVCVGSSRCSWHGGAAYGTVSVWTVHRELAV